jgi:hypothetical protein
LPRAGENMKAFSILLILILGITLSGCNSNKSKQELKSKTIAELYPGEIQSVDQIELFNGSNGLSYSISNNQEIENIVKEIKDIKLTPDSNQEGRTGYIYRIKLYEKNQVMMDIIPNHIKEIYYKNNEKLVEILKKLFIEKFVS